ncbi:hypothetical protein QR685DRAFT_600517 [Neurospora intermedia]|uniref:Uncharacterized protein n=1 Tax=Neurospora intermedia TaxID=5142 RepID=A0ABR3D1V7_NEUIN
MVLTVRTTGSIRVPGSPFDIDTISAHEPQDPSEVGGWAETLDPISFHDQDLLTIRDSPRSCYVVYISTRYGPEMEAVTIGLLSSKGLSWYGGEGKCTYLGGWRLWWASNLRVGFTALPSTGPLACEGGLGGSSVVQAHHHQRHTMYEAARMRKHEEG